MTPSFDPERDLAISRIIKAPPAAVWAAWADPAALVQWFIPAPTQMEAVAFDIRPGGALVTRMRDGDGPWTPHIDGSFLDVVPRERLVFTTALLAGWRPAPQPFMTAIISFVPHSGGTAYAAHVMHADAKVRQNHLDYGFEEGWGTVNAQLAAFVEARLP